MIRPEEAAHGAPRFRLEQSSETAYAQYDCGCRFKAKTGKSWPDWIGKEAQDVEGTPENEEVHKLECEHTIGYLVKLTTEAKFKKVAQ